MKACVSCGRSEMPLVAGPIFYLCSSCIDAANLDADLAPAGPCGNCGRAPGERAGVFRRRTVRAVVSAGGVTVCDGCLGLMKSIVAG